MSWDQFEFVCTIFPVPSEFAAYLSIMQHCVLNHNGIDTSLGKSLSFKSGFSHSESAIRIREERANSVSERCV